MRGVREDITGLRLDMQAHEQRDKERFADLQSQHEALAKKVGGHTQIISRRNDNWKLFYGVVVAAVTIFGIVWTVVKG